MKSTQHPERLLTRSLGGQFRVVISIVVWAALISVTAASASLAQPAPPDVAADHVASGRYLALLGECAGCHTDKAGRFAGGREFRTGFGIVESANITPDDATGIGTWTADQFYRALHSGRSKNGAHLYPAFPYPYFTRITRADADALYAFLRTVEPVRNAPHRNRLNFPMNIRGIMAFWNALFFQPGEFQPDPAASAELNRGAYIAQALAHCGACHSPKNFLQADSRSRPLQGGVIEGWFAPNLTADPRAGLGSWSHDDVVAFLKTGRNSHTAAGGLMAGVVQGSVSQMQDADIQAIATYLKSLPPSQPPAPVRVDAAVMARGQSVFAEKCSSCHREGGQEADLPPLRGSPSVQAANPTTLVRYVLNGTRTPATAAYPQPLVMQGSAGELDDRQIADVLTYVRNAWGNQAPAVSARQVAKVREASPPGPAGG